MSSARRVVSLGMTDLLTSKTAIIYGAGGSIGGAAGATCGLVPG
jgi:hypothetical protein